MLKSSLNYHTEFYPEDGPRMQIFYKLLVRFIAMGMFPLSTVEQPQLVALINFLDPKIKMPKTDEFVNNILPKYYNEARNRLIAELSEADAVARTTDMWTSRKIDSFMTVTVHFVNPGKVFISFFIINKYQEISI